MPRSTHLTTTGLKLGVDLHFPPTKKIVTISYSRGISCYRHISPYVPSVRRNPLYRSADPTSACFGRVLSCQPANREDAREVLQATCVKLAEGGDCDPETEFLPWAFTVARFTILSHFRDQQRERLIFDEDVMEAMAEESAEISTAFDDRREALAGCVKKLNQKQAALLHRHYTDNQSLREIAEVSGKGLSAVKMTLLRIRQRLSACIERELKTNP